MIISPVALLGRGKFENFIFLSEEYNLLIDELLLKFGDFIVKSEHFDK